MRKHCWTQALTHLSGGHGAHSDQDSMDSDTQQSVEVCNNRAQTARPS